jgi:hypothetical protein
MASWLIRLIKVEGEGVSSRLTKYRWKSSRKRFDSDDLLFSTNSFVDCGVCLLYLYPRMNGGVSQWSCAAYYMTSQGITFLFL